MSDNPQDPSVLTAPAAVPAPVEPPPVKTFLTWERLSQATIKERFVPEYDAYIRYLSFVPLGKMLQFQAQSAVNGARDPLKMMELILSHVMVEPSCKTPESVRAALNADAGLLMAIVDEVAGKKIGDEARAELAKNSQSSSSTVAS